LHGERTTKNEDGKIVTMSGNARENVKDKGFWDGGSEAHGTNGESGGKASGAPGRRTPSTTGVRVDLEFPNTEDRQETKR
jgi:hypothetical protein